MEKLLSGQIDFMSKKGWVIHTASYGEYNYTNHHSISKLRRSISPFNDLMALAQLIYLIRKIKPTMVHTHTPKAGLLGMLSARICRVPNRVHTVAGMPLMTKNGVFFYLLKFLERFTYILATDILSNSFGLQKFIHQEICRSGKIKVIGSGTTNGIDLQYFNESNHSKDQREDFKSQLGLNSIVFLFIGRVVGDKGIAELVNAFKQISLKNNDVSLLIVGPFENNMDPLVNSTLDEIKNNKAILHVGYQQDVRPYIHVSDILVFPSYREGFPNVPLQCGAYKKALILSDINGCNEIVENEVNGYLVPVKNTEILKQKMEHLYQNEEVRRNFGLAVHQHIAVNFAQKEVWSHIHQFYKTKLA